jgi:uncharacterized membrane protein
MANELVVTYDTASANLYAVIRRLADNYVWNGTTFAAWADGSIADYDIALTDRGGDVYTADFPSGVAAGEYVITYYVRAGATPAITDADIGSESGYWNGTAVTDSPAANQYVSLARAKRFMNIASAVTTYDDRLNDLIPTACRLIDNWCDVEPNGFASSTATEYYNGTGGPYLTLRRFPVTDQPLVNFAAPALEITNTSSSNQKATASCNGTTLALSRTASGTTSTSSLTIASYATLDALATAITALGNGWSASVLDGYEDWPATDLKQTQGSLNAASGYRATFDLYADPPEYLRCNHDTGTLYAPCFPCGYRNVQVTYTAGYSSIPDDLATAAAALTGALFRRSDRDVSLTGERLGDYSWTGNMVPVAESVEMLSPDAARLLQRFRRVRCL